MAGLLAAFGQVTAVRILHVSDTHGPIPWNELPNDFDLLVHSGDWFAEGPGQTRAAIAPYQIEVLRHEAPCLAAWLKGRMMLFCLGNHDLLSEAFVEQELRAHGVTVLAPGRWGGSVVLDAHPDMYAADVRGLRETPFIHESFEGGLGEAELSKATAACCPLPMPSFFRVLIAHCPPSGNLSERVAWGNASLARLIAQGEGPDLVLAGHIHSLGGRHERCGSSLVVNSARGWSLIEVDRSGAKVTDSSGPGKLP